MSYSYTGLAYFLGFLGVAFLSYRFFKYWEEEKNIVSKLFLGAFILFSLFMLETAIAGLFFADNGLVLKWTVIAAVFIQGIIYAILSYLVVYLKIPQISPWLAFFIVLFFGLATTILAIVTPSSPFLEGRLINWNHDPVVGFLRSLAFSIVVLPLGIMLVKQFKEYKSRYTKIKALGMILLVWVGGCILLVDFLLGKKIRPGPMSSDIFFIIAFVIIFTLLVKNPPRPKKERKEYISPPRSPKIQW